MTSVVSRDCTRIAYTRVGKGPAVILVDGALCYRASGPSGPLAALLAEHYTVYTYDRRGRGESGDTLPYSMDREVEDLGALIDEAGGAAFVYGISSGAALALEAANRRLPITKLALYEAPFVVDDTYPPIAEDYLTKLKAMVAAERRSDAVKLFMRRVGVPWFFVAAMSLFPVWKKLTKIAHTLPYDIAMVFPYQKGKPLPRDRWVFTTMPTLVMHGGKSPAWLRNGMTALAAVLPNAKLRSLPGQTHMLRAAAVAPVLVEFFGA